MLTNHFYGKITLKMQVPDKFLSNPKSYLTQFDQKILKMRPPPVAAFGRIFTHAFDLVVYVIRDFTLSC